MTEPTPALEPLCYASDSEEEAAALIAVQSDGTEYNKTQLLMCLRARNYDQARTVELYNNFQAWIASSELMAETIHSEKMQALLRQKISVSAGNSDKQGRPIVTVRVRNNDFEKFSPALVVQGIFLAVFRVLTEDSHAACNKGIVMLLDLSGTESHHRHSDVGSISLQLLALTLLQVPKLMVQALASEWPLRLAAFYVVSLPWFARMMFPVLKMMFPAELRPRALAIADIKYEHDHVDTVASHT